MLWFRLAAVLFIASVFVWAAGTAGGTIEMFSYGGQTKLMTEDPTKNGTISIYIAVTADQLFICVAALFGIFIAFRMWRNNYQIDHSLRHLFLIWLGMWGSGHCLNLIISIYMIIKGKDNQENMAILYDTFQRYSQDTKFVASLEKYQREGQCCGIYGPDDWLMLQLRQMPMAGGGGGGYQSLDYGFRQNPSTGKCHLVPPTIPPGCGLRIMEDVNFRLKIYAACCMAELILGVVSGALSWYCFFYWLEKEVIVIPEDEVSNVIIIEPESDTTVELNPSYGYLSPSAYYSGSQRRMSYLPQGSMYRKDSQDSFRKGRDSQYDPRIFSRSRSSPYEGDSRYIGGSRLHRGSRYIQPSHMGGSHYRRSRSRPILIHLTPEEILKEQEEALGGRVLAEMHIEHKSTKMIPAAGAKPGHHATIALVRNKNPPKPKEVMGKKGHHGQTGNLAQDIADMSGGSARDYIEDVVIPIEPPGVRPHAIQVPIGSHTRSHVQDGGRRSHVMDRKNPHEMGGVDAQNLIEGIIAPPEDRKEIGHDTNHHEHGHHGHPHQRDGHLHDSRHHHGEHHEHHGHHEHHEHHDRYLQDGGYHEHHGHEHHHGYLADGGHHHGHGYLADGGHHHDRYLHDGGHHHDGHHHDGGHHHDRYLHDGGHHQDTSRMGHHHTGHHPEDHHNNSHHRHHGTEGHHDHHQHGGTHHRDSREFRRRTTVIFKNPKPLDDSD